MVSGAWSVRGQRSRAPLGRGVGSGVVWMRAVVIFRCVDVRNQAPNSPMCDDLFYNIS